MQRTNVSEIRVFTSLPVRYADSRGRMVRLPIPSWFAMRTVGVAWCDSQYPPGPLRGQSGWSGTYFPTGIAFPTDIAPSHYHPALPWHYQPSCEPGNPNYGCLWQPSLRAFYLPPTRSGTLPPGWSGSYSHIWTLITVTM